MPDEVLSLFFRRSGETYLHMKRTHVQVLLPWLNNLALSSSVLLSFKILHNDFSHGETQGSQHLR